MVLSSTQQDVGLSLGARAPRWGSDHPAEPRVSMEMRDGRQPSLFIPQMAENAASSPERLTHVTALSLALVGLIWEPASSSMRLDGSR